MSDRLEELEERWRDPAQAVDVLVELVCEAWERPRELVEPVLGRRLVELGLERARSRGRIGGQARERIGRLVEALADAHELDLEDERASVAAAAGAAAADLLARMTLVEASLLIAGIALDIGGGVVVPDALPEGLEG